MNEHKNKQPGISQIDRRIGFLGTLLVFGALLGPSLAMAYPPAGGAPIAACSVNQDAKEIRTPQTIVNAESKAIGHGDPLGPCAIYGDRALLGGGFIQTYVQIRTDGSPVAVGVEFTEAMLSDLPTEPTQDGQTCWDVNEDDQIELEQECVGGHSRALFFPKEVSETPFQWVLMNWNAEGHPPPGIYSVPHFDFHFYIQDFVERNLIAPGPCPRLEFGLTNCEAFRKAIKDVPPQFMPEGYINVQVIEARMGNHLIDPASPEFAPGGKFTHTFIYGSYDGHITFYEPMITVEFFRSHPEVCTPLSSSRAYEISGFYPTQYCIRYREGRRDFTVSLEAFEFREAAAD
jgi:hypothetical protein